MFVTRRKYNEMARFAQMARIEAEVATKMYQDAFKRMHVAQMEIHKLRARLERAEKRQVPPAQPSSKNPFDANTIARMIRLCHPDRHDGSVAAKEVTALLLSMRQK